jgi:hypothetical protein
MNLLPLIALKAQDSAIIANDDGTILGKCGRAQAISERVGMDPP